MKYFKLVIIVFATLNLLACSSDSGGKAPVTGYDPSDIGYKPAERWPESGEFSYNYKTNYNGAICKTEQKFSGKAAFCMGLQDQKLNDNCALESRKRSYRDNCGNDFQEMNFRNPLYVSGFDQRKQAYCKMDPAEGVYFKTQKQYCEFLADENRHQECHWDRRLEKFNELNCSGAFSPEPAVNVPSAPMPTPSPTPIASPAEPLDPLEQIPVVQWLRANGYEVAVNYQSIRDAERYSPGRIPLEQKMRNVWNEIDSIKHELLNPKRGLKKLVVTAYTAKEGDTLYFDYETASGEARKYFPVKDRADELSHSLGIFYDFIESSRGSYEPLVTYIQLLEANKSALAEVRGTILQFSYAGYNRYFSKSRELSLKNDADIGKSFASYLEQLKVIAPVYAWADRNAIELENDFDLEKHLKQLEPVFKTLTAEKKSLDLIAKAGLIKTLSINSFASETKYWDSLKNLSLNTTPGSTSDLLKDLKFLTLQAKLSLELQIPTNLKMERLGEEYHKTVSLLQGAAKEIKAKSGKIKEIDLGYGTTYYPGLQRLTIDSKSTLNEVLKVVRDIR